MIVIEVVYALADKQKLLRLQVPAGTTLREAAERSGMSVRPIANSRARSPTDKSGFRIWAMITSRHLRMNSSSNRFC